MLCSPHNHWGYIGAGSTVQNTAGVGTAITSGAANTAGSWTLVQSSLTYPVQAMFVDINAGFTAATTRNSYVDIGYGSDTTNVTMVAEKLCGSHASGNPGRCYWLPIGIPSGYNIYARHQATTASASIKVNINYFGGNQMPGAFPSVSQMVCLGATTASTTGTAITPGASGAAGAITQIVASTTEEYAGVMVGGLFTVDTTMATTLMSTSLSVYIGASGQERLLLPNGTIQNVVSASEQIVSFSYPTFVGIPTGSRLSVSANGSGAADTTNSVVIYAFKH